MNLRKFEEIGHPGLCDIEMWLMLMPKWKVRIVCQENAILRYTVSEGCVCEQDGWMSGDDTTSSDGDSDNRSVI